MAASIAMSEKKPQEEEKAVFPVLTVFKNNTMIKNLFIILNNKNDDQTLLIGRHPSCNIVLTHPSISRFHLNIRFTPFSRSVSLLDLSSVHGTWVCGRKVDPGVSVDLKEGDTFTVGVSSRVYLLRFVSHFDVLLPKQLLQKHHRHVEEADSCSSDEEKKGQSKGETFGVLNGSFGTETSHCDDENKQHGCQNIFLSPPSKHSVDGVDDNPQRIEASALQVEMPGETNLLCTFKEYFTHNICVPVVEAVQGTKLNQFGGPPDTFTSGSEQPSSVEEFWFRSPTTIYPASFDKNDAVAAVAVMPKEYEFGCTSSDGEGDRIEEVFHSDNAGDSEFHQSKGDEQVSVDSPDTFTSGSEQPSSVEEFWFRSPTTIDPASFDKDAVAAVAVLPKESEFGCTSSDGEGDRIEEVFHSDNAGDSEFHQSKVDEQVSVDSPDTFTSGLEQPSSVEEFWFRSPTTIDPASFDKDAVAAVAVMPKESEFGCTSSDGEGDRIEEVFHSGNAGDSEFYQSKGDGQVSVDSPDTFTSEQPASVEEFWFRSPTTIDPASFDKDAVAAVAVMPKQSEFGCTSSDGEGDRIEEVFHSDNAGDSEFHQSKGDEQVSMDSPDTFTSEQPSYVEEFWFRSPTTIDPASFDKKDAVVVVAVMPKESEFGCTSSYGEGDRIEEVFHSDNAGDSEFHQSKVDEQVSVDSLSEEEKCCEEYESNCHNLNAKSCHERGYSQDEIVEDIGQKCIENVDPASFDENNVAAVTVIPEEHELGFTVRDNDMVGDISTTGARIFNSENTSLLVEEATPVTKIQQIVEEVSMDSISDGLQRNECDQEIQTYLNAQPCDEEDNSLHRIVEDTVKSFQVESLNPSVPQEADFNITNMKENHSSQFLVAMAGYVGVGILASGTEEATEKSSSSTYGSNSWSRRGKAASASAPQDRTRKSRFMSTNIISRSMSKDLFSVLDEEKMFTPNKENSSLPNTFHLQLMKKKGRPEESTHPKSQRSHVLKANYSPKFYPAGRSTSVSINQENWTPKLAQEWKSQRKLIECQDATELKTDRVDRVPLRSLMNSGGNRKLWNTDSVSAAKTIGGVTARASNCGQTSDKHTKPSHIREEHKRRWDMVVDTASLLNKESRKALQLLQGLKGTSLIIPQSVIRELGLIKQQYRFFRRTSEAALALEWIEECMEKTKGWIHIQSSMENPTPKNQFNSEDHILDCALQYRRKDHVGKIVVLSDDLTLKIKSMEKGLLCETVQQFRQSLVNPFSERFMWENSSPRGLTWSCQDDVVLRERYCGLPSKAGLKLITQQFL